MHNGRQHPWQVLAELRAAGPRSLCRAFFALYRSNMMAWKGSPFVKTLFLDDPSVPTRRPWAGQAFDGQEGAQAGSARHACAQQNREGKMVMRAK